MNIEEARKVPWLKSNLRPLGELLDEGYLTKERLEWAARWAYNSKLQQAARVLLEAENHFSKTLEATEAKPQNTEIEIGISIEKARSTNWPFAPHKGQPMGALVESKQISLKDLGYAVENAWDEKVKRAAIALSLLRLNQVVKEPVPAAGFVHVVSGGRSFSQRRESWLTLLQGVIIGLFMALMIFLIFVSFRGAGKPSPNAKTLAEAISTPGGIFGVIFVIFVTVLIGLFINYAFDRVTKRLDDQIEQHRLGQEGEDSVVQLIIQALDGNWHLFRNIVIPGRNKADLDLVLVGPPGVWVLEVKNFNGTYRNRGETWEYKSKNTWKVTSKSPSRQALNASLRLATFLKADHLNVFVNSAVVWASVTSPLHVENPSVAVWEYKRLTDELGNIWQGEKYSVLERNKIVEKLTKLCENQKNPDKN